MQIIKNVNYRFHEEKQSILQQAFECGLLHEKEYGAEYKDMFYDDYGADSFIQYLNAAMHAKMDCFITENERMLQRKEKLKDRFGLRIAGPEESLKELNSTG